MKKLIAISVMFALIAGVVFAEATVGGAIETRFTLYNAEMGDHGPGYDGSFPKPTTNASFGTAYVQLSSSNADGTLSGLFRLRNDDIVRGDPWFHRVFINWKPVPALNVFVGIDQDGKFGTDALEGWAFHQGACDYISFQWWDYWRAVFPGNWDGFGAAISVFPAPGVDFSIIVPYGGNNWPQATAAQIGKSHKVEDILTSSYRVQANFAVPDIGKVMFSYKGPYNNNHFGGAFNDISLLDEEPAFGALGLSFLATGLVDGMQIHLGGSTDNIKPDMPDGKKLPIYFGAALHFQSGSFGVKFRAGGTVNAGYAEDHFFLSTNIMPWYDLGTLAIFFDFGISLDKPNADADMDSGWYVNPYIKVPLSGGYLHTGLTIRQHISGQGNTSVNMGDDYYRVAFPLIIGYSF